MKTLWTWLMLMLLPTQSAVFLGTNYAPPATSCTLGYTTNLQLDLEAGNITSCTGAAVTTWPGTTLTTISANPVNGPTCMASGGSNGGPYVQTNGTSQYFNLSATAGAGNAGTIFAVVAPTNVAVFGTLLDYAGTSGSLTLYTGATGNTYGSNKSYSAGLGHGNTALVNNAWHQINSSYDGTTDYYRIDSTADGSYAYTATAFANWATVFADQNHTAGFWGGKAEAILAYNAALTTANKQLVESYLRCKYGVL